MKSSNRGLAIPIVLIIFLGLSTAGAFFYFKNKSQGGGSIYSNFITYDSPIGFSISYPEGWTVKEGRGVDNIFGEVQLLSPGTSIKSSKYRDGDILEHLLSITIAGGEVKNFQKMTDSYKSSFEKEMTGNGKVIGQKDIKIDGQDAYEIIYEFDENGKLIEHKKAIIIQ